MALFHRRSGAVDTRFLEWRVALFTIGAGLGLAGSFYLHSRWMVYIAIGILVVGFSFRFIPGQGDEEGEDEEDEEDEEETGER